MEVLGFIQPQLTTNIQNVPHLNQCTIHTFLHGNSQLF